MRHIAIDLGGRESQICTRSETGEIMEERRVATSGLAKYLKSQEPSRVIVETSAEAFYVADGARDLGHQVRVVPATLVRTLGVGARRLKTDQRDARVLSEVSTRIDLPSVHIPSMRARDLKTTCGMRELLVESRTKLINSVRGWLRRYAVRVCGGSRSSFAERVRQRCEQANLTLLPAVVRQLTIIEALNQQIAEADKALKTEVMGIDVCRTLMSMPGVGPVTAARFVACIDDVTRFASGHAVASYLGLVPGEHSSSDTKRRLSITKAGATKVRWALVQAAWCAWRTRTPDPMVKWAHKVAERRGRKVAIVALARKMACVLFAMWRNGQTYNPLRARIQPPGLGDGGHAERMGLRPGDTFSSVASPSSA